MPGPVLPAPLGRYFERVDRVPATESGITAILENSRRYRVKQGAASTVIGPVVPRVVSPGWEAEGADREGDPARALL
jgi:hypothetical protein